MIAPANGPVVTTAAAPWLPVSLLLDAAVADVADAVEEDPATVPVELPVAPDIAACTLLL